MKLHGEALLLAALVAALLISAWILNVNSARALHLNKLLLSVGASQGVKVNCKKSRNGRDLHSSDSWMFFQDEVFFTSGTIDDLLLNYCIAIRKRIQEQGATVVGSGPTRADFDPVDGEWRYDYNERGRMEVVSVHWLKLATNRLNLFVWCNRP